MGNETSSFQKGIDRLLERKAFFEREIIEYLISVNSKYNSNIFPSTQIAKILLGNLKMKKTQYPIIHKVVREILNNWKENGLAELVTTAHSGRNKRTKKIYQFSPENLQQLKGRIINSSIEDMEKGEKDRKLVQTMRTRKEILQDLGFKIDDFIENVMEGSSEMEKYKWDELDENSLLDV